MTTYQELLREQYIQKRKKNAGFSLRAFAKQLGLTPGGLSKILNGKLALSSDRASEICTRLGLAEKETNRFVSLVQLEKTKNPHIKEQILKKLEMGAASVVHSLSVDHFKTVSEWYPLLILKIASESKMDRTSTGIAKRLGITTAEVNQAIDRLVRLELVEIVEINGKPQIKRIPELEVRTEFGSDAEVSKRYYLSLTEKLQEHLNEATPQTRSMAAKALVLDSEQMDEARRLTLEYHAKLGELSKQSKKKEKLYQALSSIFEINPKSTGGK